MQNSCTIFYPGSPKYFLTAYDIALFLSIPSIIIFFVVLRTEFLRLDQVSRSTTRLFSHSGAPNENIAQNHLNIALVNVF